MALNVPILGRKGCWRNLHNRNKCQLGEATPIQLFHKNFQRYLTQRETNHLHIEHQNHMGSRLQTRRNVHYINPFRTGKQNVPWGYILLVNYFDFQNYFIWCDLNFLEIISNWGILFILVFQPFQVLKYVPFEFKIIYVLFLTNLFKFI